MANTVTQLTLQGSGTDKYISRLIHITSDGSEETDLVIYDNSAFVNDVTKGQLVKLEATGANCTLIFEWDQTTDAEILRCTPVTGFCFDALTDGSLTASNPGGAGATGDLVLTTGNLDLGDEVTIKILIRQN